MCVNKQETRKLMTTEYFSKNIPKNGKGGMKTGQNQRLAFKRVGLKHISQPPPVVDNVNRDMYCFILRTASHDAVRKRGNRTGIAESDQLVAGKMR